MCSIRLIYRYIKECLKKPERVIDPRYYDYNAIYNRILLALAHDGKTVFDLGCIFDIGPETPYYERSCKAPPTIDTIDRIADFLEVSPQWLLMGWAKSPKDIELSRHSITMQAHIEHAVHSVIAQNVIINNSKDEIS